MQQPESKLVFKESQSFRQWWLWAIIASAAVVPVFGIYKQLIVGKSFGDKPMSDRGLVMTAVVLSVIVLLFVVMKLKTEVSHRGIYFKFSPFHIHKRFYELTDIESMKVVKYSPIFDYGGWGIRGFGSNKAFSVKGNKGLKIMFKNGDIRLIGTQKPDELQKIISQIGF